MPDAISEYQKWKQQGETLKAQAKQAIETRFRELLVEAVKLSQEYQADFGTILKPPPPVTGFRYKTGSKSAAKKGTADKTAASASEKKTPAPESDPKVLELKKKLAHAKRKLDVVKTSGKSTRAVEDQIYEIEDALRLATAGS
jgi:hypothetical protein